MFRVCALYRFEEAGCICNIVTLRLADTHTHNKLSGDWSRWQSQPRNASPSPSVQDCSEHATLSVASLVTTLLTSVVNHSISLPDNRKAKLTADLNSNARHETAIKES